MVEPFRFISFSANGMPLQLRDAAACRRAVETGQIKPETDITVYPRGGEPIFLKAGAYPAFASLFTPEPLEPGASGERAVAIDPDAGQASTARPDRTDLRESPSFAPPPEGVDMVEISDPHQGDAPSKHRVWERLREGINRRRLNVAAGAAFLLLIAGVWATPETTPEPSDAVGEGAGVNMATPEEPVDPDAGKPVQTLYTVRTVNLQLDRRSGEGVGTVPRNTALTGVIVQAEGDRAQNWLKLTVGPNTGRFVWAGNLSETARPELDPASAGEYSVVEEAWFRVHPAAAAAALHDSKTGTPITVSVGDSVTVIGLVGLVDSEWAEIALNNGAIGYLPTSALTSGDPVVADQVIDDGMGARRIVVHNRCSRIVRLAIRYQSVDGWQDNNGAFWTFAPGERSSLSHNDNVVQAVSSVMYWAEAREDGTYYSARVGSRAIDYGGSRVMMEKLNVASEGGDYTALLC